MKQVPAACPHLVLLCGMERGPGAQNPSCGPLGSEDLRRFLKSELKARGLWRKQIRVATVDCLGICSGQGVSLQLPGQDGVYIVDPQKDREQVLAEILGLLGA
ncbi:MAG: (2Fe-2S) ferredoxin domain-containing protein [Myxococcota bacterium]|nr:(2Fe-2S) ferredoxin domain-containing protein [Myxococcota bacterium]